MHASDKGSARLYLNLLQHSLCRDRLPDSRYETSNGSRTMAKCCGRGLSRESCSRLQCNTTKFLSCFSTSGNGGWHLFLFTPEWRPCRRTSGRPSRTGMVQAVNRTKRFAFKQKRRRAVRPFCFFDRQIRLYGILPGQPPTPSGRGRAMQLWRRCPECWRARCSCFSAE